MSPSLAVLVFSLLAVSPRPSVAQDPAPGTNAARAKRGLLPRKSLPSRVTYQDGAARRRGEARAFPASPAVNEGGAAVVAVAGAGDEPAADAAGREGDLRGGPAADAVGREGDLRDELAADSSARQDDIRDTLEVDAGREAEASPAGPDDARDEAPREVAAAAPPPSADAAQEEEEAADRARDEAVSVSVLVERIVDRRGRILERRMGRDLQLLSVRVVARVDQLPVVSSERLPDGRIRERVELEGSTLEVLRDPVGRFISARAAPGPEDEDDDEG